MSFEPVSTLEDLDSLDHDQIVEGYRDFTPGDPEPGPNRGRAYWHGWRNRAIDHGQIPKPDSAAQLAHLWLKRNNQCRNSRSH